MKPAPSAAPKKKLGYLDSGEWESIEERIAEAETELEARKSSIQDPAEVRDGRLLESAYREMEEAQRKLTNSTTAGPSWKKRSSTVRRKETG